MSIQYSCACGKTYRIPESAAGKRARCTQCSTIFTVPQPELEPVPAALESDPYSVVETPRRVVPVLPHAAPRLSPAPSPFAKPSSVAPEPSALTSSSPGDARAYRYLLLLLALLPLAWSTFRPSDPNDVQTRLVKTVTEHPDTASKLKDMPESAGVAEVCSLFPDDKIDGALLPYGTYIHWLFALVSGLGFFGVVLLLFPPKTTKPWQLLVIAIFTGTIGILLLLAVQWIAFHVPFITPRGIVGLLIDIVAFIGLSYRMALGDSGFLLSALGFTAGVGFCEEACKALPLIWKARTDGFYTWRSAMIWGMISGVGFGVSEGITYSHDYYNGIQGGQVYLIRFVSCVALHAIWAAATGINIFRRQDHFRGQLHVLEWIMQVAITVIVPMILHGFYDTLLKQKYDWAALLVALASFGWLAFQIELAKHRLQDYQTA